MTALHQVEGEGGCLCTSIFFPQCLVRPLFESLKSILFSHILVESERLNNRVR